MAQTSGFFNAFKTNGVYSPKYNANDFANNLAAIISTGVRRSGDNDLYVQAAGGMALTVAVGRAWIKGRWYFNDSTFTSFTVPTAPTGDRARIDRVVLRLTIDGAVQNIALNYLTGEAGLSPVAPALTRNETTYEIALADIEVNPNVTQIAQTKITDQRANTDLCGWITTPIGYNDYFASLDAQFEDWFAERRNDLAVACMYREYSQRIVIENLTNTVTFNITQYDPSGVDILKVYVNGLRAHEGTDYTVDGSTITFENEKIAGTEIDVYVAKSIDGTGLGSVQDAVDELQEQMSTMKNIGDYLYICNGYDDNVKISQIAEAFFADETLSENAQLTLNVYGTLGINAPYSGSGLTTSRYRWFSVGTTSSTNKRRITIDFLNASPISMNGSGENHYICFFGGNVTIKNAVIIARQRGSSTAGSVQVFVNNTGAAFNVENCKFDVSAYLDSFIASKGTFRDCTGTVTCSRSDAFCFRLNTGLLRVFGGTYAGYTGLSTTYSGVFGETAVKEGTASIVAMAVNCPTQEKASHYQTHAARFTTKTSYGVLFGTITSLSVATAIGGGITILNNIPNSHAEELI